MIAREEDAALWRPGGWYGRDLSARVVSQVGDADKRAAFVTRAQDALGSELVRFVIDAPELARIQQDVVAGRVAPSF